VPEINLIHDAIPFFVGLLVLEAVIAAHRKQDLFRRADTLASLGLGLGNVVVGLFWKGIALGAYSAAHQWALFDIGTGAGAWVALIVLDDLIYYWWHRLHHEIRFFWASHVTHHSSRRYNLSTALRQSWTSPMTALPFYLPLAWLGFEPLMIVAAQSINLIYQFWVHTQLVDRLGPLEWILNTPSHHRVHHGANVDYLDRNYAGIFIVWDRLFGTFEPELEAPRYGLTKNVRSYNPVYLAFHEFGAILRDAMRAPDWRTALAFVFAPPGWSPDGSTLTASQMRAAQNSGRAGIDLDEPVAAAASR
jgi:sterol desaturase/sphingolipid hydroxylase (fatty acid hydroxylase superfamily)